MPTYEYKCTNQKCNRQFDRFVLSAKKEYPTSTCPYCGKIATKQVSLTNFKCDLTPKFHKAK